MWACSPAAPREKEFLQVRPERLMIVLTLFQRRANPPTRRPFGSPVPHISGVRGVRFVPLSAISHSRRTCLAGWLGAPIPFPLNPAQLGRLERKPRFIYSAGRHHELDLGYGFPFPG